MDSSERANRQAMKDTGLTLPKFLSNTFDEKFEFLGNALFDVHMSPVISRHLNELLESGIISLVSNLSTYDDTIIGTNGLEYGGFTKSTAEHTTSFRYPFRAITVKQHYTRKHKYDLQFEQLPCIIGIGGAIKGSTEHSRQYFPLEILQVCINDKMYNYGLIMEQHANRWGPKELYPTIPTRVYLEKRTKARPILGNTGSETNLSAGFNTPTATWGNIEDAPTVARRRQDWLDTDSSDPEAYNTPYVSKRFPAHKAGSNTQSSKRKEADDTPLKFNSERMFYSSSRNNQSKQTKATNQSREGECNSGTRLVDVVEPTFYVRLPAEDNDFRFPPIRRGEFGYHVAVRRDPTVRQLNLDSDEWN